MIYTMMLNEAVEMGGGLNHMSEPDLLTMGMWHF